MRLKLPLEPLFILFTLQSNGFEGYIVGGAVRDLLLKANQGENTILPNWVTDYDFTTNATPDQIQKLFTNSFYENKFGTVSITQEHLHEMMGLGSTASEHTTDDKKQKAINLSEATKIHTSLVSKNDLSPETEVKNIPNYEMTTYRSDGVYSDHRRPDNVEWGKTIEDDLSRRDFTINAMALQIKTEILKEILDTELPEAKKSLPDSVELQPDQYQVIDLFKGMDDLHKNVLNPVGEPARRFEEDALRMLRAVRFSVQLNMKMTDETFAAISALAEDIQHVSWERIRDEVLKMLKSDYPAEAIELLDETGLLHFILPEVREGKGIEQGGHHTTDVWTHSLDALRNCPSPDPIVRFATLLHDVAKPRTFKLVDGKPTFYNHEIIGSRMAKDIAQRFRFSKRDIERVFALVRYHMFYYQPEHTDAAIRRFMRNVGLENINDILDLREADRLGSGARKTSWRLEEMKERMVQQLHQPFAITDLKINGTDLMNEFQLKPGPILGQVLHALFEKVLEQPELNVRETLLQEARQEIQKRTEMAEPSQ
jgi:tRNA nucleotidyltransferase (CCA-adding enzyme)